MLSQRVGHRAQCLAPKGDLLCARLYNSTSILTLTSLLTHEMHLVVRARWQVIIMVL